VDTDAFIAVHREDWDRLDALTRRRTLDADEIDDLLALYQRTATQLSQVRSTNPDPVLTARLSMILHRARLRITGARVPLWRHARDFLWNDLPAALFQARWTFALCAGFFLLVTLVSGLWFGFDASARSSVLTEVQQRQLAGFAASVWTNNAWIAAQSVVFGVTGIWPVWMLLQNGVNIGMSGGVLAAHGELGTFFVFLLPHGLLEMTAIVMGAGAGLRLFWAWVHPGPVPRGWALARASRAMVTVAVGLVGVLLVSGMLEGFVTPSSLPAWLRVAIGVVCFLAFLALVLVRGRAAYRAGITGDLDEELVGDRVAVAA
jgi:uncharacterized membrane protein SpoIIM required for sporulation